MRQSVYYASQKIKELLNLMIKAHRELLEILREEKKALSEISLEGIQRATKAKIQLIGTIRVLEKDRIDALSNLDSQKILSLHDLILLCEKHTFTGEAQALKQQRDLLLKLIEHMGKLQQQNSQLIQQALSHIRAHRPTTQEGQTSFLYTRSGVTAESTSRPTEERYL